MSFCQPILPKGQKRRSKGFKKVDLILTGNREVLSSNPIKGKKNYHSDLMFPAFKV
jgi:hypothetical protein